MKQVREMLTNDDWSAFKTTLETKFGKTQAVASALPCPYCNDLGVIRYNVPVDHEKFGKLFPCDHPDCAKGRETRERAEESGYMRARLPEEYRALTFATWDALPADMRDYKFVARAACHSFASQPQHYVSLPAMHEAAAPSLSYEEFCSMLKVYPDAQPRNGVVLYGKPGVGKTGLVAAAINLIRENGGKVLYTRAMAMFQELYASQQVSQQDDHALHFVETLKRFQFFDGVLVIDEVNIEDYTPARKQWLQEIVRERLGARKPFLMTCNLTREQFESAWGTWTFSVLHSKAWWIHVKGLNMREIAPTLEDPEVNDD